MNQLVMMKTIDLLLIEISHSKKLLRFLPMTKSWRLLHAWAVGHRLFFSTCGSTITDYGTTVWINNTDQQYKPTLQTNSTNQQKETTTKINYEVKIEEELINQNGGKQEYG